MSTALQVAEYYLTRSSMTPKKLQKIVYYAYSWFLTLTNESLEELDNKLFEDRIEAWVHGPVIPSLYNEYRDYGYQNIPQLDSFSYDFNEDTLEILNEVWEVYGDFTANELESLTHQEEPWIEARQGYGPIQACNVQIKDETIFECYGSR